MLDVFDEGGGRRRIGGEGGGGGRKGGGGRRAGGRGRRREGGGRDDVSGFVNENVTISSIFDEWRVGSSVTRIYNFEEIFFVFNDNAV